MAQLRYNYANKRSGRAVLETPPTVAPSVRSTGMHTKSIPTFTPAQTESFWSKVEVHHPAGCWEWTGSRTRGYGRFYTADSSQKIHGFQAHRVAFTLLVGPIPRGLTIDHLCQNQCCVNPDHMQVVPNGTNILRSHGVTAMNKRKSHCSRGHAFTPENTYHDKTGGRECRICRRADRRAYALRQRSA